MTNKEWRYQLFANKRTVSDSSRFTASSASESCADTDHGVIWSTYLASEQNYGETRDSVILARIPVTQPEKTQTIDVVKKGVVIDGTTYNEFLDCNAYLWHSEEYKTVKTHFGETGPVYHAFVRVIFLACPEDYFYTDYDTEAGTFTPIRRLQIRFDGKTQPLTGTAYVEYMKSRNLSGQHGSGDAGESVILTDKLRLLPDGYRYTFATANGTQPVFLRVKDHDDTFEVLGHIPVEGEYETQSAYLNGKFYAIVRSVSAEAEYGAANFWTSEDNGKTWLPGCRVEFAGTRPQCLPYDGKLLVAYSVCGVEPNLVRDGRNNCRLVMGEGPDLSEYKEIFFVADPRGMVYYDIVDYNKDLYAIWSDASLHLDKNPQAKDVLYMAKIGDLRFIQ